MLDWIRQWPVDSWSGSLCPRSIHFVWRSRWFSIWSAVETQWREWSDQNSRISRFSNDSVDRERLRTVFAGYPDWQWLNEASLRLTRSPWSIDRSTFFESGWRGAVNEIEVVEKETNAWIIEVWIIGNYLRIRPITADRTSFVDILTHRWRYPRIEKRLFSLLSSDHYSLSLLSMTSCISARMGISDWHLHACDKCEQPSIMFRFCI